MEKSNVTMSHRMSQCHKYFRMKYGSIRAQTHCTPTKKKKKKKRNACSNVTIFSVKTQSIKSSTVYSISGSNGGHTYIKTLVIIDLDSFLIQRLITDSEFDRIKEIFGLKPMDDWATELYR